MDQYLKSELEELNEFEGVKPLFVIKDLEGLNWAFRKMAAIQSEVKKIEELAARERFRIDEWEKNAKKAHVESLQFFESKIYEYHENELAKNPKLKSIKTPYGTAKTVTRKAEPVNKDETLLKEYVKANTPELIETVEKIKWAEIKKKLSVIETHDGHVVIDENGEIVPGVEVKPQTTTFKAEVNSYE